jgi:molybdenum cofactor cytidylyltransferase
MKQAEDGNLAAILLAAGPSTRLGQAKQLVRIDGESLVRRSARLLLTQKPASITVVTGYDSENVEKEIDDLPVDIAFNQDWALGMGASIACGVRNVTELVDGLLIMVCDQWLLDTNDLFRLIYTWKSDISGIVMACWHEGEAFVSGPPVIFPGSLKQELKFAQKNRGARQLVDRYMDIVEFVTMENAARDLDRPEDLEQLPKI